MNRATACAASGTARTRLRIEGSSERPRLNIFRSTKFIYAQVIDDTKAGAPSRRLEPRG